jgi:aminopeptidase N
MNEDAFTSMMKEYFNSYSGKKASTEDFKRIVDKHFGEDMSWFFNQYIYGTEIPFYKFAYKYEETENGKFLVTCRVDQEQVPDNFKMYVPVLIKLDGDRFARVRVSIEGKQSVFNLPLLPEEPEEIIFNDLNGVLCEVEYESWD